MLAVVLGRRGLATEIPFRDNHDAQGLHDQDGVPDPDGPHAAQPSAQHRAVYARTGRQVADGHAAALQLTQGHQGDWVGAHATRREQVYGRVARRAPRWHITARRRPSGASFPGTTPSEGSPTGHGRPVRRAMRLIRPDDDPTPPPSSILQPALEISVREPTSGRVIAQFVLRVSSPCDSMASMKPFSPGTPGGGMDAPSVRDPIAGRIDAAQTDLCRAIDAWLSYLRARGKKTRSIDAFRQVVERAHANADGARRLTSRSRRSPAGSVHSLGRGQRTTAISPRSGRSRDTWPRPGRSPKTRSKVRTAPMTTAATAPGPPRSRRRGA